MKSPIRDGALPFDETVLSTRQAKNLLRQEFRNRRAALSGADRSAISARICERLQVLPEIRNARTVHVYWPMIERGEIDLRPLIRRLLADGVTVALPVITPDADLRPGGPRMHSRRFTGEIHLIKNLWGVPEPLQNQCVPSSEINVVIVPALGVSRTGYRIGYGKGHYDEFLSTLGVPTVCAIYESCLVDHVPTEPHDVPVSMVVTENETVRTGIT
ncbi:MAG TPA: 5-formyltetrahydrofolate cyclo-ligase [Rhodothermales bacterium]|nr:5-formyltetrahydrofolate cyclo-ligase [Rhodothermales bacterium]